MLIFLSDDSLKPTEDLSDFEVFKSRMTKCPDDIVERQHKEKGFAFGPQFNLITDAWSNANEALALITPTQEILDEELAYVVHPSIIDACIQTTFLVEHAEGKFVPYKIEGVTIIRKVEYTRPLYSHVNVLEFDHGAKHNITLYDGYARPVLILQGYIGIKITENKSRDDFENASFNMMWSEEELVVKSEDDMKQLQKSLLILRDRNGYAKQFTQHLSADQRVTFVDMQDTAEETKCTFSHSLDEALERKPAGDKLLVLNFWPCETSIIGVESQNFLLTHSLAFESCLVVSQQILERESSGKDVELVFVTSGVVSMPNSDCRSPTDANPATFPWSATVLGFRRTFSEEINHSNAAVIDLPENPDETDFLSMMHDVQQEMIEEEIAYRNGVRYVNRLTKLNSHQPTLMKQESPVETNGERKPFKLAFMSGDMFLQTASRETFEERIIEVYSSTPVLHKPWAEMETSDRVVIAGRLLAKFEESRQNSLVVGVCKVSDFGSYVNAENAVLLRYKTT